MTPLKRVLPKVLAGVLAALSFTAPALAQAETVEVTITYRERMALPPDAMLEVKLLDVSRMDIPSTTITEGSFPISGVPVMVPITYDPAEIDDRMSYSVSARILSGDSVIFRSTSAYPVITRGAPDTVEMVLERSATPVTPVAAPPFAGIAWAATEITGRALVTDDPPTMTVDAEGNIAIYAGCNRYVSKIATDGDSLRFLGPLAGTMMACPDARMKLESDTIAALDDSVSFVRYGNNLTFSNEAGIAVLRFQERPE